MCARNVAAAERRQQAEKPFILVTYVRGQAVPFVVRKGRLVRMSLRDAQLAAHWWGVPVLAVALVATPRGATTSSRTGTTALQGPFDMALGLTEVDPSDSMQSGAGPFPTELEDFHRYVASQQSVPVLIYRPTSGRPGFGGSPGRFYGALSRARNVHFDLTGVELNSIDTSIELGAQGGLYRGNFTVNELLAITSPDSPYEWAMQKTTFYRRLGDGSWEVVENTSFPWVESRESGRP